MNLSPPVSRRITSSWPYRKTAIAIKKYHDKQAEDGTAAPGGQFRQLSHPDTPGFCGYTPKIAGVLLLPGLILRKCGH